MTFGQEIIAGLSELCDVVRDGVPLSERFRVTVVNVRELLEEKSHSDSDPNA